MLCIYCAYGLKSLISKWPILTIYTAVVLILQIAFQFFIQTGLNQGGSTQIFWDNLPDYVHVWIRWLGFYQLKEKTWQYFLPYVIIFALAAQLQKRFRFKLELE